jgi:hypothetical protein
MASSVALASLAPARRVVLSGRGAPWLATQLTARLAVMQKRVVFVCGDNRFDPYEVARIARAKGVAPTDALRSILIARAFTVYQLVELVRRLPQAPEHDLVIISGLCSTFFDEDVSILDAARLFYRVLWQLAELSRGGMMILISQPEAAVAGRRAHFLADLCRNSDVVLRLTEEHSFTLERRRILAVPRLDELERLIES